MNEKLRGLHLEETTPLEAIRILDELRREALDGAR